MNTLLIYIVKSALYLASFFFVYILLKRDTLYSRNRLFIILSAITSYLLPLITIETGKPVNIFFGKTLNEVLVFPSGTQLNSEGIASDLFQSSNVFITIYIIGVVFFALKLIFNISEILFLLYINKKQDSKIIRFSGIETSGFSAFGKIFINSGLSENDELEIIKHEQNHLDKNHFIDIIFIELLIVIQWFNPFAHLFNRSLREIHEFQADEGCIRKGISVLNYQKLLLNQVFRSNAFQITNSFSNPTLIKKRMIMMTKKRSNTLANLKLLLVLPVIAATMIAFSSCREKSSIPQVSDEKSSQETSATGYDLTEKIPVGTTGNQDAPPPPPPPPPFSYINGDTIWASPDIMPIYKIEGGDKAIVDYISKNVVYPKSALEKGIQGKVIISFSVDKDGSIENVKVSRGVDPDLDAEATRVIKNMPAFEAPGYKNNKPVAVWYLLPITFALK